MEAFRWARFQFILQPKDQILLPAYKGSAFRGGFGHTFRNVVCAVREKDCAACMLKERCIYCYIFETPYPEDNGKKQLLAGNSHIPHPFIIEPPLGDKRLYSADDLLNLGLILIGRAIDYFPYFIFTFHEWGRIGIGKGRGKYQLEQVYSIKDGEKVEIYNGEDKILSNSFLVSTLADINGLSQEEPGLKELTIRFLTPTRIKHGGRYITQLPFPVLLRAILWRLSCLSYFHCNSPLNLDCQDILTEASQVSIVEFTIRWHDWERYSQRQDTRMKLGGIVGDITYGGDLARFLPYLLLAQELHVGKATSFGLGQIAILNQRWG